MGWGMGIGMGWPNATASSTNSYALTIMNCAGTIAYIYSASSTFEPGIYVYTNPELTTPFDGGGSAIYWNTWVGFPITGGYEVGPTGDVKAGLNSCA